MKTVITVVGIRPDFIRMSEIFKKLDKDFNHILIHTGQHFDKLMSGVFFDELEIRKPDYNLEIGGFGKEHFHQLADVSVKLIELIRKENLQPDIILFLGDSNMLEEINRTVCDHCSDIHFVYHEHYKEKLVKENLPKKNIYVVGNTIVEVCNKYRIDIYKKNKTQDFILMDVHRPENFKYDNRLTNIIVFGEYCSKHFGLPVKMLKFAQTMRCMIDYGISSHIIDFIDLMSYKEFLRAQYDAKFLISDSGTAQEEPALLNTPVIVPRDYTERPESLYHDCSIMLDVNRFNENLFEGAAGWIEKNPIIDSSWLGNGKTADTVIDVLKKVL
jgi:UDP-N-acetylglucosamine 2-epimerase (non-hydrolysing)